MESQAPKVREVESDDAVLVERFRKGDERAFEEIYNRHAKVLASIIYRMLGDDLELDDIVQDTFIIASKKMDGLREPSRLRSWLITIAVRRVRHTIASRGRKRMMKRALKWNAPPASVPSAASRLEALVHALETLSPKLRIPWHLHRVEGETLADTARISGVSVATVKRRVHEADQLIERRLQRDS